MAGGWEYYAFTNWTPGPTGGGITARSPSTTTLVSAAAPTIVINNPSSLASDVMVALIGMGDGTGTTAPTAPSGWTLIGRTDQSTTLSIFTYWKVATGSEPASYTWTFSSSITGIGGITSYVGVDNINPIDTFTGNTGTSGTDVAFPALTTAFNNECVLSLARIEVAGSTTPTLTTPTSNTPEWTTGFAGGSNSFAAINADIIQVAHGSAGSASATSSITMTSYCAQSVALIPVAPIVIQQFQPILFY